MVNGEEVFVELTDRMQHPPTENEAAAAMYQSNNCVRYHHVEHISLLQQQVTIVTRLQPLKWVRTVESKKLFIIGGTRPRVTSEEREYRRVRIRCYIIRIDQSGIS